MPTSARTLFVSHPDCEGHYMGATHPESAKRLQAIIRQLTKTGTMDLLERVEAPSQEDSGPILKAHAKEVWEKIVRTAPADGLASVSPEAIMSRGTLAAIKRGVGGSIEATTRVCSGQNPNAFVAVRPPGHHATRHESMGFCFVNNAAIAAYHALDTLGLSRVAIVDIDVHHGNGTEDVVAGDKRLFMASTFGAGIYPGNGQSPLDSNMRNVALRSGLDGAQMREIALKTVFPALDQFAPELVIVSAGYDAHRDDPLGNQAWDDADYRWWFAELQALAHRHAQGRLVAILEGGYDVNVLARCVEQSILGMAR